MWFRGFFRLFGINCDAAFFKYLPFVILMNLPTAIQPNFIFLTIDTYMISYRPPNIYTQSSHLPSVCPSKANLWMDIIYQLLDRYLGPDPVWHWDCAFSRSIWPRDVVSCLVECTVPGCFPVSLNIPLSGASKTHLKIIILIISLNHWLLSLILLSLLLSLYFQIPSVWEVTFFRKLPSCFCATFTKFLPSAIFINPSADRIPSLCLSVLNKTPIIFQTNGLCTRHNRYSFHYHHFTS